MGRSAMERTKKEYQLIERAERMGFRIARSGWDQFKLISEDGSVYFHGNGSGYDTPILKKIEAALSRIRVHRQRMRKLG